MKGCQIIFLLFFSVALSGQEVLDDYIRYGLGNNIALKQKLDDYELSIAQMKEARGMFLPGISVNARYTVAEGGRVIDFPVGDLLNPVYSTLNMLTSSGLFPLIENQQVSFLRPREHETKLRLAQPVFSPGIYYNSKIRKELTDVALLDADQYRRELIAEIRKAYYSFASAQAVENLLQDSRKLLTENIRVNRSLLENSKVTWDALYRSEAELNKFDQQLGDARRNTRLSAAWFNFLLNKPLGDTIYISIPDSLPLLTGILPHIDSLSGRSREEILRTENYVEIAILQEKMEKAGNLPDLFIIADYGFQGEEYRFNSESDYMQASALLTWTLFEGFTNREKKNQARIRREQAERSLEEVKHAIELQVMNAVEEIRSSDNAMATASGMLKNAREGYRIVERKYSEGMATMLELIDARTTMTSAAENLVISKYRYLSAIADYKRIAAVNENF